MFKNYVIKLNLCEYENKSLDSKTKLNNPNNS